MMKAIFFILDNFLISTINNIHKDVSISYCLVYVEAQF